MKNAISIILVAITLESLIVCGGEAPLQSVSAAPPEEIILETATASPQDDSAQTPSLTVTIEGESVLLVDMSDPLVQGFFSGCDGYDVDSLGIVVSSRETPEDIPGHFDPRYTFPMFLLDLTGHEYYVELMAEILNGEKMANLIIPSDSVPKWSGILFDETGFPFAIGNWAEDATGHYYSVDEDLARFEKPDRAEAYRNYFRRHIPVDIDGLRGELVSRDFDLNNTTIKAGFFGYPGFFITDGEHELVFVSDGIMNGSYQFGAYVTPKELAADLIANAPA
jgi:predicted small lipoprotein YifL